MAHEGDREANRGAFTPFGRGDARVLALTADDERLLARAPRPLRILVPVSIEEAGPGDGRQAPRSSSV